MYSSHDDNDNKGHISSYKPICVENYLLSISLTETVGVLIPVR